eukprot:GHRR01035240.1.p1 GENE.GHRR01035240.1~~GHRR01035240.1.p1  ORF type:complete len:660 (+),score=243.45 GHRR01035240.1:528-2507(+)
MKTGTCLPDVAFCLPNCIITVYSAHNLLPPCATVFTTAHLLRLLLVSLQALVIEDDPEQAFAQLQEPLSTACPKAMPSLLLPLVVAAPFGSGKRAVLQQLVKALPEVLSVPRVVTTKPRPLGSSVPEDMEVISSELAQQLQHGGSFLVQHEVLGHTYGITTAAVRKLQASGKLPLLDLDRVADVQKLKAAGFKATYVYLQPPSLQQLRERVKCNLLANAPPQHDPAHAADAAAAEAVKEAAAAAEQAQLFDAVITHDPQELLSTAGRLSELLHECYPLAVPPSAVWGYGRPLWDPSCRVYGRKPLRILLLGPAASGKSTASAILASRFGIPHINAGDLLYAEVAAKTPLGLEAKQYMHSSRTVPDRMLLSLLLRRLDASDCQAQGWALDGFPHTRKQAEVLADAGHVPDKVILLEGPHALLLDRVKHRRIDYKTGKVYHLAEPGALSEAVRPVKADGSPDQEVLQRLAVRHDDSLENVANRLALWDRQVQGLRAVYEDVILRLPAAGSLQDIAKRAEAFIRLEADIMPSKLAAVRASGSTGTSIELTTTSWKLEELTYRVVTTLRWAMGIVFCVMHGRRTGNLLLRLSRVIFCIHGCHGKCRLLQCQFVGKAPIVWLPVSLCSCARCPLHTRHQATVKPSQCRWLHTPFCIATILCTVM